MTEHPDCHICGIPATTTFAGSPALPLCSNWACEQAVIQEINSTLSIEVDIRKNNNEGAVP